MSAQKFSSMITELEIKIESCKKKINDNKILVIK